MLGLFDYNKKFVPVENERDPPIEDNIKKTLKSWEKY